MLLMDLRTDWWEPKHLIYTSPSPSAAGKCLTLFNDHGHQQDTDEINKFALILSFLDCFSAPQVPARHRWVHTTHFNYHIQVGQELGLELAELKDLFPSPT